MTGSAFSRRRMTAGRRQHYVWRKYLEPWTARKGKARQLWCLRRERATPILVDTKNVAVERDFYRLTSLEPPDVAFVRALVLTPKTHELLRSLSEGWIEKFALVFALDKAARSGTGTKQELQGILDREMIEFEERAYARLENDIVSQMAALVRGDVTFFEDDDQAVQFAYYVAHQYFRTKAMRERIGERFTSAAERARFDRTWPILRYVFATNLAYSIFALRRTVPLQVMRAPGNLEFITSDQPVVNTYGAFVTRDAD